MQLQLTQLQVQAESDVTHKETALYVRRLSGVVNLPLMNG